MAGISPPPPHRSGAWGVSLMSEPMKCSDPPPLRFNSLKIAYSWKCNAVCAHCSVSAGPGRREVLDRSAAQRAIDEAAAMGLSLVELTGGEMFLFYRDLLALMEHAQRRGLPSVVDTNGFWAKTPEIARRRLETLKGLGLNRLILSTDRYHQAYVPLERVVTALAVARELEIAASVTVTALEGDPTILETVATLNRFTSRIEIQQVAPFGRAADLPRERMARVRYLSAGLPCDGVLAPTLTPDLRVSLCCAPPTQFPRLVARESPLILGWLDRESLAEILGRAQANPFLALLAAEGLGGVLERLSLLDPDLYRPHPGGYFGPCHLCSDVLGSEPCLSRLKAVTAGLLPHPSPGIAPVRQR